MAERKIEVESKTDNLYTAIKTLANLQVSQNRNQEQEKITASQPIEAIRKWANNFHPDFNPVLKVTCNKFFTSNYYPPAKVEKRPSLQKYMEKHNKNFDLHEESEKQTIQSYIEDLTTGINLGYPELGDKWYLTLTDSNGTYYLPVEEIQEIKGIGF